jgi:hypothetical protein
MTRYGLTRLRVEARCTVCEWTSTTDPPLFGPTLTPAAVDLAAQAHTVKLRHPTTTTTTPAADGEAAP